MKELMYKAPGKKQWVRHYSRPDNHPDVKEWEAWIAHYGPKSPYKIRTIPDSRGEKEMKKVEEKGEGLLYRKIHQIQATAKVMAPRIWPVGDKNQGLEWGDVVITSDLMRVLDEARNSNPFNPLREAIIIYRNLENHTEEQKQIIIEEHLKNCNLVKWILEEIEWFEKWFGEKRK